MILSPFHWVIEVTGSQLEIVAIKNAILMLWFSRYES